MFAAARERLLRNVKKSLKWRNEQEEEWLKKTEKEFQEKKKKREEEFKKKNEKLSGEKISY